MDDHLFSVLYRGNLSIVLYRDHLSEVLYGQAYLWSALRTNISPECSTDNHLSRVLYERPRFQSTLRKTTFPKCFTDDHLCRVLFRYTTIKWLPFDYLIKIRYLLSLLVSRYLLSGLHEATSSCKCGIPLATYVTFLWMILALYEGVVM